MSNSGRFREIRKPRKRRRLVIISVAGLIVTLALPWVLASSLARPWISGIASRGIRGQISWDRLSLGWFAPLQLEKITVTDAERGIVMEAEHLETEKGIWSWLLRSQDCGTIRLVRPTLHVHSHENGTNVQDLLLEDDDESDPTDVASSEGGQFLRLEIIDATVAWQEASSSTPWTLNHLHAVYEQVPGNEAKQSLRVRVPARSEPQAEMLALDCEFTSSLAGTPGQFGEGRVKCRDFPLAHLAPWLSGFDASASNQGTLEGVADVRWEWPAAGTPKVQLALDTRLTDLRLESTSLGPEPISLADVRASVEGEFGQNLIALRRLDISSGLGDARLEGEVALMWDSLQEMARQLSQQEFSVTGSVDVAKVLQAFPQAVPLHEEVSLTGGQAEWHWRNGLDNEQFRSQLRLNVRDLVAEQRGQEWSWQDPLDLNASLAASGKDDYQVRVQFRSSIAQGDCQGTMEDGFAAIEYDLRNLHAELRRFVDLEGWNLAGKGNLDVRWRAGPSQNTQIKMAGTLRELAFGSDADPTWSESYVQYSGEANLRANTDSTSPWESISVSLETSHETWQVSYPADHQTDTASTSWPLRVTWRGDLASWSRANREAWLPDGWELRGTGRGEGRLLLGEKIQRVEDLRVDIENLQMGKPGSQISEPRVVLQANLSWNGETNGLRIGPCSLNSRQAKLQAEDIQLAFAEHRTTVAGNAGFECDREFLQRLLGIEDSNSSSQDRIVCQLSFRPGEDITQINLAASTQDSEVQSGGSSQAADTPSLDARLTAEARWRHATQDLEIASLQWESRPARATLAGEIRDLSGEPQVAIQGELSYDVQELMAYLPTGWRENVRFTGRHAYPFRLHGSLPSSSSNGVNAAGKSFTEEPWLSRLAGDFQIGWQNGVLFGLPLGETVLRTQLADGHLVWERTRIPISEGNLHWDAALRLVPTPRELTVARGPLVERVRITPQACSAGLQYIAPLLAQATSAEGTFSLDLAECRIPWQDPAQGSLSGQLTIHRAEVRPGPLAREIMLLAEQVRGLTRGRPLEDLLEPSARPLLTIDDETTEFAMAEGRVYHRGFTVEIGDVRVTTYGAVGLDQSLQIVAQVPIDPEWLRNTPRLQFLGNQVLEVPIGGTLQRPQADRRALMQLNSQLFRGAAQELLRQGIEEGLQRLLQRGR